ncbi:MAG: divalent-cation tolerance protein CutA [Candidatus Aenigmarchaeota archaeon]|nr:divalent-cation tolerance protein CutA [Candidatus Aenigmarchaeota archaeon]
MRFVTVYITCKNGKEAEKIGQILVEQRLAGCVNIIPKIKSIYRWQGKIANDNESLLLAKAPAKNRKKIVEIVRENHNYSTPCINFLPVDIGNPYFKKWLEKETK